MVKLDFYPTKIVEKLSSTRIMSAASLATSVPDFPMATPMMVIVSLYLHGCVRHTDISKLKRWCIVHSITSHRYHMALTLICLNNRQLMMWPTQYMLVTGMFATIQRCSIEDSNAMNDFLKPRCTHLLELLA